MSSINKKYNWNNSHEINKTLLLQEFKKANFLNKFIIFRKLNDERRKSLRFEWDKDKEQRKKEEFLEYVQFVLKDLNECMYKNDIQKIDINTIQNEEELFLITGMLYDIGKHSLSKEDSLKDVAREKEKFDTTKEKMIKFIKTMQKRKFGKFTSYYDNTLLKELESFQYVKHVTKTAWIKHENKRFLWMMEHAGISKINANEILISLNEWVAVAPNERYYTYNYHSNYKHNEILGKLQSIDSLLKFNSPSHPLYNEEYYKEYCEIVANLFQDINIYISKSSSYIKQYLSEKLDINDEIDESNYARIVYLLLDLKNKQYDKERKIKIKAHEYYKNIRHTFLEIHPNWDKQLYL